MRHFAAGVQGAKVLWSSRERAFGPSPVSRYLDCAAQMDALPLAQKGAPQPPHMPLPRRRITARLGRSKVNPAPDSFLFGEGVGPPKSPHVCFAALVLVEAAVAMYVPT